MVLRNDLAGRVFLAAAGLLLAYAALRVLQPLVPVLAASALLSVVVQPLYARLLARLPDRPTWAAALASAGVCLALAVPLGVGGWYLVRESVRAYPLLREQAQALLGPDGASPPWMPETARGYIQDLNLKSLLSANIQGIGAWSGRLVGAAVGNAAELALNLLVFVASLFLFLRDGREAFARLAAAAPLPPRAKARIFVRTHDMIIATVQGVFAVAVVQGVLSTAGFFLLGVRFPVLLGALCMAFSPIPFAGPAIVWVPVAVRLALAGEPGRAALVALWFALIVGTSDNVLRPFLVGSRARLPAAFVFIGVLGGVLAFGAVGTFLGPIILAVGAAVADALLLAPAHGQAS